MSALVRPVDPAPRARKEPKPFLVTPQLMNEAAAAAAIAAFNLPAPKPPPAARCGSAGAGDDAHGPRKSGAGTPSTPTTPTTPVQEAERAGSETPDAQSGGSCSSSVSAVGRDAVLGLGLEAFDQSCAPRAGGSAAAASSRAPYQVRNLAVKAAMAPFEPAEQQQQQQLLLRQAAAAAHLAAALPREPCFSLPPPSWEAHPVPTSAPMQPPERLLHLQEPVLTSLFNLAPPTTQLQQELLQLLAAQQQNDLQLQLLSGLVGAGTDPLLFTEQQLCQPPRQQAPAPRQQAMGGGMAPPAGLWASAPMLQQRQQQHAAGVMMDLNTAAGMWAAAAAPLLAQPAPQMAPLTPNCMICGVAAADTGCVHGSQVHRCCCVPCGLQMVGSGRPCPVCCMPFNGITQLS